MIEPFMSDCSAVYMKKDTLSDVLNHYFVA
nr:MAG TPA: hypothetical protein [Caudoviricetes sp.]